MFISIISLKTMKNKRSQGMSINVIIMAALALVVLVVLLAIFTGSIGKTSQNIGSCITKGGICADDDRLKGANTLKGTCGGDYPIPIFVSGECPNTNPKNLCCIKAGIEDKKQ